MPKKMCVKIEVVRVTGTSTSKRSMTLPKTEAKLSEVLEKAGLSEQNMQVTVNGEPAKADTIVLGGAKILLTERVSGS